MKKKASVILIALRFLCCNVAYTQTVYHFSNTGDDKNNGLSAATPFKTIQKINSLVLKPGDSVLLKKADVFRGQLNIRQSGASGKPIVIGAYGTGAKPVLSGAVMVDKWVKKSGNIWEADCPQCADSVTGVYMNSSPLPLGRYPNINGADKGYLKIQKHLGTAQFTGLQTSTNWTGGRAVIRTNDWIIDKLPIASLNGNSFNLELPASYEIKDNFGYFIQDHPATLDQNGEWYFDRIAKKLLIWFSGTDPNKSLIEATAFGRCVNVYASNISVQDLRVTGALNIGIYGRNSSNFEVTNCTVSNMGEDGIVVNGKGENVMIKNNYVDHVNNNGIYIAGLSSFICEGNTLKNIGTEIGRGKSGNGNYIGIVYNYDGNDGNTIIKNNELDSIGYIGINFNSGNVTIEQNIIDGFDVVKNDGGAIHTYDGNNHVSRRNQKIISNILCNGYGSNAGTTDKFTGACGVYLDVASENIEINNNTVFNCTGAGILLHGTNNISVSGNTSYGNNIEFFMSDAETANYFSNSNSISNNIFLGTNTNQVVERLLHGSKAATEGSFPNTIFKDNQTQITKTSLDSKNDAVLFEVNRKSEPKSIALKGSYKDLKGNPVHDMINLAPYSSIILLKQ